MGIDLSTKFGLAIARKERTALSMQEPRSATIFDPEPCSAAQRKIRCRSEDMGKVKRYRQVKIWEDFTLLQRKKDTGMYEV